MSHKWYDKDNVQSVRESLVVAKSSVSMDSLCTALHMYQWYCIELWIYYCTGHTPKSWPCQTAVARTMYVQWRCSPSTRSNVDTTRLLIQEWLRTVHLASRLAKPAALECEVLVPLILDKNKASPCQPCLCTRPYCNPERSELVIKCIFHALWA